MGIIQNPYWNGTTKPLPIDYYFHNFSSLICGRGNAFLSCVCVCVYVCLSVCLSVCSFVCRKTCTWWSPKSSYPENRRFSWKPAVFRVKSGGFHTEKLINQIFEHKLFSFMVCRVEAMSQFSMKTAAFHENHCFSWKLPVFHENPLFIRKTNCQEW